MGVGEALLSFRSEYTKVPGGMVKFRWAREPTSDVSELRRTRFEAWPAHLPPPPRGEILLRGGVMPWEVWRGWRKQSVHEQEEARLNEELDRLWREWRERGRDSQREQ